MPIFDQTLPDGQIVVKNVVPHLSMLDSAIVHHHDQMYQDPAQRKRVDWVVAHAAGQSVIEVGTATGYVISQVKADRRAGVDNNIARLLLAKMRYPDINFYYANIFNLTPFYDQGFDCIIATEIIEHIKRETVRFALHHCLRVAPKLVVTLPFGPNVLTNAEHLWSPTEELFYEELYNCGMATRVSYARRVEEFMTFVIERISHA